MLTYANPLTSLVLDSLMMGQSRKEDAGMWGMFEGSLTALKTKVTG